MKNTLIALAFALTSNFAFAADPGFVTGNQFTAVPVSVHISVSCQQSGWPPSGPTYGAGLCEDVILNPAEYVSFVGPTDIDANQISLKVTRPNGSWLEKIAGYDAAKGKSTSTFNLWMRSLTQKPLLNYGDNAITYSFRKNGQEVLGGSLTATVSEGEERRCRYSEHFTSGNSSDCTFVTNGPYCRMAFARQNWCQ